MELWDYVKVLRRRWVIVVATTLLAVLVAGLASVLATPMYRAQAQVFVSTQSSESASDLFQGSSFAQQRVRSYADVVTTPKVLQPVVDELDLDTTVAQLGEQVSASVPPETVLIDLAVVDEDPEQARAIANAVAASFVTTITELETPQAGGASPVRVTVVEDAATPTAPFAPDVVRNIGLAVVLGLAAGFGLALLRHSTDTRLRGEQSVREITEATILGGIPFDPDAIKHPLAVRADTRGRRAEAFRQLRTNLQFVDASQHPRSVVITSSIPEEGKSTTACNLAIALSEAGRRVCLVEADLRRPKISNYLGLEGGVGVTTVLIAEAELADVLQPWGDQGLVVLAAGQTPPNPSELLGSRGMDAMLRELELKFDHVLIDAPPLLPVTDAAVVSKLADGVIMVVGIGSADRRDLARALTSLESVGSRLLGVVLNRLPTKGADSDGYYGYGYHPTLQPKEREPRAPSGLRARH